MDIAAWFARLPGSRRRVRRLLLTPTSGVEPLQDGGWRIADEGTFALAPADGLAGHWAEVQLAAPPGSNVPPSSLVVDAGGEEHVVTAFQTGRAGHAVRLARVPPTARLFQLRVGRGDFRLDGVDVRLLGSLPATLQVALPLIKTRLLQPHLLPLTAKKLVRTLARGGLAAVRERLFEGSRAGVPYSEWRRRFRKLTDFDREAIARLARGYSVRISVLMPVYETPEPWLSSAIASVRAQLYPHWELCIADDASRAPHVRRILEQAAAEDARIKLVFRERNGHISAASNSALELATGDFVALLDHDDELAEEALFVLATAAAGADLIYSDEDKIDEQGQFSDPFFKPDWNPDLLLSQNYVGHLCAVRRSLLSGMGGFREGFEGSQDYDVVLRATATGARIRHLPFALYHWRSIPGSTARESSAKSYAQQAALRALQEHLGPRATVEDGPLPTTYRVRWPLPAPPPLVSLIIPTRDGRQILETCVESILRLTAYRQFELLVVDNQSREPATLAYLDDLAKREVARVLRFDAPFNFSAINNFAARQAKGTLLGLLNNDLEAIDAGWLEEMVSQASRAEVGAVGARLLYPDRTVQHGGVILGIGGVAGHEHKYAPADAPGYFSRAQLVHDVSAVTAACLLVRKQTFERVGGFDETFAVAFNDVDFCLRVRALGLRNLWTPFATLLHHESKSRGRDDDTPAKLARFRDESRRMMARWGDALRNDPAYNLNLTLESEDFGLAWPPRVSKPWDPARGP